MTVVSTQEFNANNQKYFDMAVNSEVCIKDDNHIYQLTGQPIEPDILFEPDDDFYRSITMDEFRKRAIEDLREIFRNGKR